MHMHMINGLGFTIKKKILVAQKTHTLFSIQ